VLVQNEWSSLAVVASSISGRDLVERDDLATLGAEPRQLHLAAAVVDDRFLGVLDPVECGRVTEPLAEVPVRADDADEPEHSDGRERSEEERGIARTALRAAPPRPRPRRLPPVHAAGLAPCEAGLHVPTDSSILGP
jgi:hypothetical protein